MTIQEYRDYIDSIHSEIPYNIYSTLIDGIDTIEAEQIKKLEEMYQKFEKKLWSEHEDVRGDDMIEVGYAEQFLQDLLLEFGCWDEEKNEQ